MEPRPIAPNPQDECAVARMLQVIGGTWKPVILGGVAHGVNRFGTTQRTVATPRKRTLTQPLRAPEAGDVLLRQVFPVVPPRVDDPLTDRGRSRMPGIDAVGQWGTEHA